MGILRSSFFVVAGLIIFVLSPIESTSEAEATIYLEELEGRLSGACNLEKQAAWNYVTNVTAQTQALSVAAAEEFLRYQATVQGEILDLFPNWRSFSAPLRRQFQHLSILGPASMSADDHTLMEAIRQKLNSGYSSTTICDYNNPNQCDLGLGAVDAMFNTVEDYDELEYYWTSWHNAMSANVNTSDYSEYMYYQNLMARYNGFSDMSEMWLAEFNPVETPNWSAKEFKDSMTNLWEQIQPYYNILHAYLRMKIRENPLYVDRVEPTGSIPANLVQGYGLSKSDLTHFYAATKPFPNALSIMESGTSAMIDAGYTVRNIFEHSDDFFDSLGLSRMTSLFWENSMFEDPQDGRVVNCNPPFEWDMCNGRGNQDFRIKVCGEVNMNYMSIIHHEMGHMEYFMHYTNENYILRDGANPGFHEGVGNLFQLPISTPRHLECVLGLDLGLGTDCNPEGKAKAVTPQDINYLYSLALDKFAFYAYTIALEEWRWEVFEEVLSEEEYNSRWWSLKQKYQGVKTPTPRPDLGFDAATRIITTPNYIRYYNSYILQFQLYESFCQLANQGDDPETLHQCDFTGNHEVGDKLRELLSAGFTQPWPAVLQAATGQTEVSVQPMLNFFKPLFDHLSQALEAAGQLPCFDDWCTKL